ncbi:MAG: hypothetical protein ABSB76_13280 [Streptosporangiaceae bacterium]
MLRLGDQRGESGLEVLIMYSRSQLHRRRSFLARAWDQHIPAICDKRPAASQRAGVRTEIVASWERSAAYIMPEVAEAPLADLDETRNAFAESPLPPPASCGRAAARSCAAGPRR